ncbi:hypothetical protein [Faecalibaculum rodentium]|uniref:hypothetical protein n=3 Tax=Faecalibaculum rodentium TaxID=1702221 RepID=UPI00260584F6|nr:hypothetical protein [Faecalibaculum rodentium]
MSIRYSHQQKAIRDWREHPVPYWGASMRSLVLLISFSLLAMALAVVLQYRNFEVHRAHQMSVYGKWTAIGFDLSRQAIDRLDNHSLVEKTGCVRMTGETMGMANEAFYDLAEFSVTGTLPQKPGETAVQRAWLDEHGLSYQLGQNITVGDEMFELCGILENYTDAWTCGSQLPEVLTAWEEDVPGESEIRILQARDNRFEYLAEAVAGTAAVLYPNTRVQFHLDPLSAENILGTLTVAVVLVCTLGGLLWIARITITGNRDSIRILKVLGMRSSAITWQMIQPLVQCSVVPSGVFLGALCILHIPLRITMSVMCMFWFTLSVFAAIVTGTVAGIQELDRQPPLQPLPKRAVGICAGLFSFARHSMTGEWKSTLQLTALISALAGLSFYALLETGASLAYQTYASQAPDFRFYNPDLASDSDLRLSLADQEKLLKDPAVEKALLFFETSAAIPAAADIAPDPWLESLYLPDGTHYMGSILCFPYHTSQAVLTESLGTEAASRFEKGESVILYTGDEEGVTGSGYAAGDPAVFCWPDGTQTQTVIEAVCRRVPEDAAGTSAFPRTYLATPYLFAASPAFFKESSPVNAGVITAKGEEEASVLQTTLSSMLTRSHLRLKNMVHGKYRTLRYFQRETMISVWVLMLSATILTIFLWQLASRITRTDEQTMQQLDKAGVYDRRIRSILMLRNCMKLTIQFCGILLAVITAAIISCTWISGLDEIRRLPAALFDYSTGEPTGIWHLLKNLMLPSALAVALYTGLMLALMIKLNWLLICRKKGRMDESCLWR